MKLNSQRGEIFTTLAIVAFVILGAVFIPNDLSKAAGIQNKQNKIVQKETSSIEMLKNPDGTPVRAEDGSFIVKRVSKISDSDEQQSITLWERILALPLVLLVLVCLGAAGIPGFAWVAKLYKKLKENYLDQKDEARTIVQSLDDAFATIPLTLAGENLPGEIDRAALAVKIENAMKKKLSENYDESTKEWVRALRSGRA